MLLNCGVWTSRRSNWSILKEISPGCSLEGLMLKLKLQYFGHLMRRVDSLEKTLMLGGIGGRRRREWQDEMAGWHHRLDGHEFLWTPGVGDGQGDLACCDLWGRKESDTTERLNWTELSSLCYTVGPCWLFILYIVVCICSSQTPNLPLPSIFSFLKNCQTVSKVAAPFHIPLSNGRGLKSVHKFTNTTITGEGCCLSLGSTSKQGWSGSSLWL